MFTVVIDNNLANSNYRELQEIKLSKTICRNNDSNTTIEGITALNFSFRDTTTAAIGSSNGTVTLIDVTTENIL